MIPYIDKYKASKDTLMFAKCRLRDSTEPLVQLLHEQIFGKLGIKRARKPKCYYRRWCINEWFFKDIE